MIRRSRGVAAIVIAALALGGATARAQPGTTPATRDAALVLRDAALAGTAGDWARAGQLLAPIDPAALARADRAEAHRLRGLVAFFAQRPTEAEREFLAYLRLELDAHLDPAVVPPEAVAFFEDVRLRHAAMLRALRPKPRRWLALDFLPPWGQFQNGQRTKGWVIGGIGLGLLAADVGTYALLRSWCSSGDHTCDDGGTHTSAARTVRTVNLLAGGALIGLYLYGVIDGIAYRRHGLALTVAPTEQGGAMVLSGHF